VNGGTFEGAPHEVRVSIVNVREGGVTAELNISFDVPADTSPIERVLLIERLLEATREG
jgi:hypothetical protein